MKKVMKAVGLTAALAVMIPLSAFAASPGTSGQTSTAAHTRPAGSAFGHRGFGGPGIVSQDVLDLLKLDKQTLNQKLASGESLAQIAQDQGVTRDQLKQALTDAFDKQQAQQKQQFTDNLDKLVDGQMKMKPGKGGMGKRMMGVQFDLSAISSQLGLTQQELKDDLKSGKTIADLAADKSIDVQQLIDAEKTAIVDQINQAVTDGKLTQAQADKQIANAEAIAEKIVNGAGTSKWPGHWKSAGGQQGASSQQDSSAPQNAAS
ncbi:hypothetical protein [Paenibacillus humicola]|uniref:hypothetical protein n=1 Tax=Paenibacillus humicola TaxID=3110540 RepID=UPI00237ABB34|nr:hypothetical protein [Paenibacillus humicola]